MLNSFCRSLRIKSEMIKIVKIIQNVRLIKLFLKGTFSTLKETNILITRRNGTKVAIMHPLLSGEINYYGPSAQFFR